MSKYKYILFDNDGTIVNTIDTILFCFKKTAKSVLKIENPNPDDFKCLIGLPLEDQYKNFTEDEETIKKCVELHRELTLKYSDKMCKNYDGLPQVLEYLYNQDFKLGIVTSKIHDFCVSGLKVLGIDKYFDYIQGCDDYKYHKPDPKTLEYAANKLELRPHELLYIGDSSFDVIAASKAGLDTCAVTWGAFTKDQLIPYKPNFIVDKPSELIEIIEA